MADYERKGYAGQFYEKQVQKKFSKIQLLREVLWIVGNESEINFWHDYWNWLSNIFRDPHS